MKLWLSASRRYRNAPNMPNLQVQHNRYAQAQSIICYSNHKDLSFLKHGRCPRKSCLSWSTQPASQLGSQLGSHLAVFLLFLLPSTAGSAKTEVPNICLLFSTIAWSRCGVDVGNGMRGLSTC